MAKLTGPLFSETAHGTLADVLTYSNRKKVKQVRFQKKQVIAKPNFAPADNQSLYRLIIARWRSFSQNQQDVYNQEAIDENLQITGWNLFVRKAMGDPLVYLGLAGYWTFNREGFETALDISKNGNDGKLEPTWPTNSPKYIDSKNSQMRKALIFDGVNDYVDCGNDKSLFINSGDFTVSYWAKVPPQTDGSAYPAVSLWENYSNFTLFGFSNERIRCFAKTDGVDSFHISLAGIFNRWVCYSWVHTISDKTLYLYVNGVYEAHSSDKTIFDGQPNINIGIRTSAFFPMKGIIDEVSIYNRALSAGEIKDIYNMYNVK